LQTEKKRFYLVAKAWPEKNKKYGSSWKEKYSKEELKEKLIEKYNNFMKKKGFIFYFRNSYSIWNLEDNRFILTSQFIQFIK